MKNIVIETNAGSHFDTTAKRAKDLSIKAKENELDVLHEFDFNGINCIVGADTNLEWLFRDYQNAFTMGWKTIGHDCVKEYSEEVKIELEKRIKIQEEKSKLQRIEWDKEEQIKKDLLFFKIKDTEFSCINNEILKTWEDSNSEGYGKAIIDYAKMWGRLMQYEISQSKLLEDIADKCSHDADIEEITGFMYGAAVKVLVDCWEFGKELQKWHNKSYNYKGDGVVNPAVLTITV
jgi:hypothetical protein